MYEKTDISICPRTKTNGRCSPEGPGWGSSRGTNGEDGSKSGGAMGRTGAGGSGVVWRRGETEKYSNKSRVNVVDYEEYNNGSGSI